ncbi:DUF3598 family protein [Cylindrospermopsis raciborskii CHAB3438]|uniref:DUF3598 family protein n=1 Tax=Cylindrospermopsis raciborskii TaxID=77022 RepID=UPI001F0D229D|nr:DUF3598 family protein [Cylindrospermopsis raciborskii]MCH4904807.1 DUF3598 family protein [Cylindrospermopsis raciborskii CHAB3438]MEB3145423.1 DUF3598 family protein [Cylindrospermopsis raciborskii]
MLTNWRNFLKNAGEWRGSFTRISGQGEILDSTLSILNLEATNNNETVLFRLRRFQGHNYDSPVIQDYQQEYTSLAKENIFFETGAFSKGTVQLAPFAEFGAEYGFVHENRRSRLVQLYNKDGELSGLTLIREFRSFTDAQERPQLTVEQLIGKWQGISHTVYSDLRPSNKETTYLEIKKLDNGHLEKQQLFAGEEMISLGKIVDNRLIFEPSSRQQSNQKLNNEEILLPDGVSSNVPPKLERRKEFFIEAGWLVKDTERQRLIRSYNAQGEWISSSHIVEIKMA